MTILTQQESDVKQKWIRLSNDSWVKVPQGADPETHRRFQEARLKVKAQPRRRAGSRCRRGSKRSQVAKQRAAIYRGMAEATSRANGKMSEAETAARQAQWEAENPADDCGLGRGVDW